MPMLEDRRADAVRSFLDGASYLLGPVGDPSLRPLAGVTVVSADHEALLADWLVSGLDLRRAAVWAVRECPLTPGSCLVPVGWDAADGRGTQLSADRRVNVGGVRDAVEDDGVRRHHATSGPTRFARDPALGGPEGADP
jgi:hypothetical protein